MPVSAEILFVGTNAAKYSPERAFSSLLLHCNGFYTLVDCGENTTGALYKKKIPLDAINAIVISHFHPDHYAGLVPLILQMKLEGRIKPLDIYVREEDVEFTEHLFYSSYMFRDRIEFDFTIKGFRSGEKKTVKGDFAFIAKQNTHLDEYREYDPDGKLPFTANSFLFRFAEKKVFYTSDIGGEKDLSLFKDEKPDVIITEGQHLEPDAIIELQRMRKPDHTIVTHYDTVKKMRLESALLKTKMEKDIIVADDGLKLRLGDEIEFGYFSV